MPHRTALYVLIIAAQLGSAIAVARTARVQGFEITRLEVGDAAPNFKLFGVDYRYHSPAMYPDKKAIVLVFHSNDCPVSQMNRELWVELARTWQDRSVQILAINPNPADMVPADGFPQMIEVARENGYNFPYLYDETQRTAAAYGARRTDDVFVLGPADEHGRRRIMYIGPPNELGRPPLYVVDAVEAILRNSEVEVKEVPEYGCTISYRNEAMQRTRGISLY